MRNMITVLILLFLVNIHELGHFIMAKINGVKVVEFSIGMGPKIIQKEIQETVYTLRLLPIGGYCSIYGMDEQEEGKDTDDTYRYDTLPYFKKITILAGGSIFNMILGFLIICTYIIYSGVDTNIIKEVSPYAHEIGFRKGDMITEINLLEINDHKQILPSVMALNYLNLEDLYFKVHSKNKEEKSIKIKSGEYRWLDSGLNFKKGVPNFTYIIQESYKMNINIYKQFIALPKQLIKNEVKLNLTGIIGISRVISMELNELKEEGIQSALRYILYITALLSANLAIMNLLPIPALDGGHIIIETISKIANKSISSKLKNGINLIGFGLLIVLTIAITIKDIFFFNSIL